MDTDQQLEEMESWLIGCVNFMCSCGSYLLDPAHHENECIYKIHSTSNPDGWVSIDGLEFTGPGSGTPGYGCC